jgi:hypothetical protein
MIAQSEPGASVDALMMIAGMHAFGNPQQKD